MRCPRCFKDDVSIVANNQYVCNNETCVDANGKRTQFEIKFDDQIHFPYNQIFINRAKSEFYRVPYFKLAYIGNTET